MALEAEAEAGAEEEMAEEARVVATVAEQAVEKEEADVRVERGEAVRGAAVVAGTARVMARVMTVAVAQAAVARVVVVQVVAGTAEEVLAAVVKVMEVVAMEVVVTEGVAWELAEAAKARVAMATAVGEVKEVSWEAWAAAVKAEEARVEVVMAGATRVEVAV